MRALNVAWRPLLAGLAALSLVACGAEGEPGETDAPIINGTSISLGANSFVRFYTAGCSGMLVDNSWALTAAHCAVHVGDSVYMDSQTRTADRVVNHPDLQYGVDIALVHLSAPMAVGGSTSGFRRNLRTTLAPAGSIVRCFGYGKSYDGPGVDAQLRLAQLAVGGGASSVYFFVPNAQGQSIAQGDAGGTCLDDQGASITVLRSFYESPTVAGETFAITSTYYAAWANLVVDGRCEANSDCTTGICNTKTQQCVSSTCQDGVRDNGETGVDCGGTCTPCRCPWGTHDCGGVCIPNGRFCP